MNPRPRSSIRSNRLCNQAMSSTHSQSELCRATPILSFIQCLDFISAIVLVSFHAYFNLNFAQVTIRVWWYELIHMVLTTEGFLEAAIESWSEWDSNPRSPILFRHSNRLSYQAMYVTSTQCSFRTSTPISSFI